MSSPTYLGPAQRRRGAGIQLGKLTPDQFAFGLPTPAHLGSDKQLPGFEIQSGFDRVKDVARLQLKVEAMKFGPLGHSTLGRPTSPVRSKPVVFTSTKVRKFAGVTSYGTI